MRVYGIFSTVLNNDWASMHPTVVDSALAIIAVACALVWVMGRVDAYRWASAGRTETETFAVDAPATTGKPKIYVKADWGLGNRLRTLRVAYAAAKTLGAELLFVNAYNEGNFNIRHLDELFVVDDPDVRVVDEDAPEGTRTLSWSPGGGGGCTLSMPFADFEAALFDEWRLSLVCCEIKLAGFSPDPSLMLYRHLHVSDTVREYVAPVLKAMADARSTGGEVVGVHIRQGHIYDYNNNYFFDYWDSSANEPPTSCCFADVAKNVSSCLGNAPHLERFVELMRQAGDGAVFFVCSDRPGCLLNLEQFFPHRIIYNPIKVEHTMQTTTAFCDMVCLANCDRLIVSQISSFSTEAELMGNVLLERRAATGKRLRVDTVA